MDEVLPLLESGALPHFLLDGQLAMVDGNGAELPDDGADLIARVAAHVALMGDHCTGDVLWLYGTDHQVPSPDITRVIDEANAIGGDTCFRIGTLAGHLAAAPTEGLPHI